MKLRDLFEETYWALSGNKVRSTLTMLGIVIGIGSVIAMVAIGAGAQSSIEASIEASGSNLVTVVPGMSRGVTTGPSAGRGSAQTLTLADAEAIGEISSSIKNVSPEISRRYQVTAKGTNTNTQIIGSVSAYIDVRSMQVAGGTFITEEHVRSNAKIAVIGPTTRDDLFGVDADPVGQTIKINNILFKIVGVLAPKGGTGFTNPDDAIYIPISTAQRFLTGNEYVSTIGVQAIDESSMQLVKDEITNLLLIRHKISDPAAPDFTVMSQADIVATASTVTSTFTMLLASIAGISLLVGGIGIMNMMLTNVTERTREIGLRKAIGAERGDISKQFLMESIALTFIGGAFGILLGWVIARIIGSFAGLTMVVSLSSIALSFGVSAGIGIVFGYYPARRAARLNPIDALRFE